MQTTTFPSIRPIASPILGLIAGTLIAAPAALQVGGYIQPLMLLAGAALGAKVGYTKRNNALFFYVGLLTVLILSTILFKHGFSQQPIASTETGTGIYPGSDQPLN